MVLDDLHVTMTPPLETLRGCENCQLVAVIIVALALLNALQLCVCLVQVQLTEGTLLNFAIFSICCDRYSVSIHQLAHSLPIAIHKLAPISAGIAALDKE